MTSRKSFVCLLLAMALCGTAVFSGCGQEKNNEERDDITIIVVFFGTTGTCLINEKNNFLNKIDEIDNDDKENSSNKILWLKKKL